MWVIQKIREITLTDETAASWITYVGTGRITSWTSLTSAKTQPIWQVVKYVKTGSWTVLTDMLYPYDATKGYSPDRIFIWNNRASLTYDA